MSKITGTNNHYSLISLSINGLNAPIRRHRLTDWIPKQDPTFCCIQVLLVFCLSSTPHLPVARYARPLVLYPSTSAEHLCWPQSTAAGTVAGVQQAGTRTPAQ